MSNARSRATHRRLRVGFGSVASAAEPVVVGVFGVVLAALGIAISLHAHIRPCYPQWAAAPTQAVGLLLLGAGLFVWRRQPDAKRMARLLAAAGITWYIGDLQFSRNPLLFDLGFGLFYLNGAVLTHLLLAFPDGRLARRSERMTVIAGYVITVATQGLRLLAENPPSAQICGSPARLSVWAPVGSVLAAGLTVVTLVLVWQRWKAEPGPVRRSREVYWAAVALIGMVVMLMIAAALARAPASVQGTLLMFHALAILLLGVAVLVGSLRMQMAHRRVSRFLTRLGQGAAENGVLREALADALEDPSLTLHFRRSDSDEYVDSHGLAAPLPANANRAVTLVGPKETPLAALVHDPVLALQPRQRERLDAVVAAAGLALEAASLQAKDRARMRGILEAELATRQNIRAMLHDGPQHALSVIQRLVGQAREQRGGDTHDGVLERIAEELRQLAQDLREVTDGVYPSVLPVSGLAGALDTLAQRSPVPLIVDVAPGRWPRQVEETAFLIVSEAVGNAQKHAQATSITVRAWEEAGRLVIEVSDDGRGGAVLNSVAGSGLRGMLDRVGAHEGVLVVESPPGGGTTVRAVLPCV